MIPHVLNFLQSFPLFYRGVWSSFSVGQFSIIVFSKYTKHMHTTTDDTLSPFASLKYFLLFALLFIFPPFCSSFNFPAFFNGSSSFQQHLIPAPPFLKRKCAVLFFSFHSLSFCVALYVSLFLCLFVSLSVFLYLSLFSL